MNSASEELGKAIDAVQFHDPIKPVYPNVTGKPVSDPSELRALLLDQLTSPVLWAQIIK
jgi:[acyl-carrier-protein] S-malonyltransferase